MHALPFAPLLFRATHSTMDPAQTDFVALTAPAGRRTSARVVELKHGPRVHSGAHCGSPRAVEFQPAWCGGVDVVRAAVGDAAKQSVVVAFSAPEAPKSEVVP